MVLLPSKVRYRARGSAGSRRCTARNKQLEVRDQSATQNTDTKKKKNKDDTDEEKMKSDDHGSFVTQNNCCGEAAADLVESPLDLAVVHRIPLVDGVDVLLAEPGGSACCY